MPHDRPFDGGVGLWLALAGLVLVLGVIRVRSPRFATSRRNTPVSPSGLPS